MIAPPARAAGSPLPARARTPLQSVSRLISSRGRSPGTRTANVRSVGRVPSSSSIWPTQCCSTQSRSAAFQPPRGSALRWRRTPPPALDVPVVVADQLPVDTQRGAQQVLTRVSLRHVARVAAAPALRGRQQLHHARHRRRNVSNGNADAGRVEPLERFQLTQLGRSACRGAVHFDPKMRSGLGELARLIWARYEVETLRCTARRA